MTSERAPSMSEYTLRCREMIDGRYTELISVTRKEVVLSPDHLDVTVTVYQRLGTGSAFIPGRFKATYLLWWENGPPATACEDG